MLQLETDGVPKIMACISIKADLSVVLSVEEKIVPSSQFKDLIKDGQSVRCRSLLI